MKKKLIIGIIVLVGVVFIVVNIAKGKDKEVNLNKHYYQIYTLSEHDFSESISLTGKVSSDSLVSITSNLEGAKIKTVNVEVGDIVEKGDLIATIDTSELQSELNELLDLERKEKDTNEKSVNKLKDNKTKALDNLQESIDELQAKLNDLTASCEVEENLKCSSLPEIEEMLNNAKKEYREEESTFNENIEEAENTLKVSSYTKQIKELRANISSSKIYAPESGLITSVNVNVGTVLTNGNIATLQTDTDYKIVVSVPEVQILKIKKGMNVTVKTVATGDEVFMGTISKVISIPSIIENVYDQNTVGYSAVITIDDKDTNLLVGMTAKCKIMLSEEDNLLSVPYDAIRTDDSGTYVYKLIKNDNGYVVSYTNVTLGKESSYYTEITSGLTNSEMVLITDDTLENGQELTNEYLENFADFIEG